MAAKCRFLFAKFNNKWGLLCIISLFTMREKSLCIAGRPVCRQQASVLVQARYFVSKLALLMNKSAVFLELIWQIL